MRSFKKAIVFVVAVLLINQLLLLSLKDDVFMRINILRGTSDTYQDVIIGTSQARSCIDPTTLESLTGRKTANLSIPLSAPMDQYFLLKQIVASGHKPERVIYEVDPYYFQETKAGGHYYCYPMGLTRLEYFFAGMQNDWRITFSPWVFQLGNYYRMPVIFRTKIDFYRGNYDHEYKGFVYKTANFQDRIHVDGTFHANQTADRYMKKLIRYCAEEGIELIVIQTPVGTQVVEDYEPTYRESAGQYFEELAAEYGHTNFNFNLLTKEEFDADLSGYIDTEGHMRGETAEKFTEIAATYLK